MNDPRDAFLEIYQSKIKRAGSEELLEWLTSSDFFTAPASTRYHGSFEGGLVTHSVNVYRCLAEELELSGLSDAYTEETVALVSLLHDVCKAMDALGAAVTARNEKIANQQLGYEQLSVDEFLNNYESYAGFSLDTDYMSQMVSCCLSGDVAGGLEAERLRNLKIDTLNLDVTKVSFNDLYLLSKIITSEAGSNWLSMEWKMMVGEVLLNRVASPEFPDSIEECIYQTGQYYSRGNQYFANLLPYEDCVEAALRLLNGERIINDGSVVFQANFRQGSGTYLKLYDQQLGYTYLCYSSYPELYES